MTEKKEKILKGKIIIALMEENGGKKVPDVEIDRWYKAAKILYKVILETHFERNKQKAQIKQLTLT